MVSYHYKDFLINYLKNKGNKNTERLDLILMIFKI